MKKRLTILFLLCSVAAMAQNQKIDPTLEVNRDYQGKMMEITKGKLSTAIADSLGISNLNFNYAFATRPYRDMYEFSPVPSVQLPRIDSTYTPILTAKAGIGAPLAPEATIMYTPLSNMGNYLNFKGSFNLFKGKVPAISLVRKMPVGVTDEDAPIVDGKTAENGNKVENKEYRYGVGGDYTHTWESGELNISAGFNGGYSTYYGCTRTTGLYNRESSTAKPEHHTYTQVGASVGIKSSGAGKYGKKFNYAAKGSFTHTKDKSAGNVGENLFTLEGEAGPTVGRYNKFMAGAGFRSVGYKSSLQIGSPMEKGNFNMGLFHFTPQYRYENGSLKVNIGVKLEGFFGNREDDDRYTGFIFPAVDLMFNLLPHKLWLYGKVDGHNTLNTYSRALERNSHIRPEYTPETLMAGSVPVNIEAGLKGRNTDRFHYSIHAGYTVHKGLQQFIYDQENGWFNTFNSNTNEFWIGGEVGVNSERLQGRISARYSSFTRGKESTFLNGIEVVGFPALQGEFFARYNWNRKVYAGVECKFRGKDNLVTMYGDMGTVPAFAELNGCVEYVYNPTFTFWLRGDNLLNRQLQYQPFYAGRGIGFSAGIIVQL